MKHIAETIFLFIIFILNFTFIAYAVDNSDWNTIYSQDFSEMDGYVVPDAYKTDLQNIDAVVKDGALEIVSDNLCFFTVDDLEDLNSSSNSHGITLKNTSNIITPLETPVEVDGILYYFESSGDSSIYVDEKDGLGSIKQFTYYRKNSDPKELRTNFARFDIDSSMFSSNDQQVLIELEYYAVSGTDEDYIVLQYPGLSGELKSVRYTDIQTGQWSKAIYEINDVDFSKKIQMGNELNSLMIKTPAGAEYYIHSVTIQKSSVGLSDTGRRKEIKKDITESSMFFDGMKFTYDLTFPSNRLCSQDVLYNKGQNEMAVNVLDQNDTKIASLIYNLNGDTTTVYAVSTDNTGTETKYQLFTGNVFDRQMTHVVSVDLTGCTYTVTIYENTEQLVDAQTFTLCGISESSDSVVPQYISVEHHPFSSALLSVFDNINIQGHEDMDYRYCNMDADVLQIDVPESGRVQGDFELPQTGSLYGSEIVWSSSDSNVIEIIDNTSAYVKRSDSDQVVTLMAQITYGKCTIGKEFYLTVVSLAHSYASIGEFTYEYEGEGVVGAKLELENSGEYSGSKDISFMVISEDKQTGKIIDRQLDSRTLNQYQRVVFEIHGLKKTENDVLRYFLWDNDHASLVNNPPTKVSGLAVENKTRSINLSWDESFDDNDALNYYAIYRDGELVDYCNELYYSDTQMEPLVEHKYEVIAIDTNENASDGSSISGQTIEMLCSLEPIGNSKEEIDNKGNGLYMVFSEDTARDAYTEYAEVTDADGVISACRYAPQRKYMTFYTDKNIISSQDQSVVIEVTYLDTVGDLTLVYNTILPPNQTDDINYARKTYTIGTMTGTNRWKTAVIKINDAQFRQSLSLSAGDFAVRCTENDALYVKKVEVTLADKY